MFSLSIIKLFLDQPQKVIASKSSYSSLLTRTILKLFIYSTLMWHALHIQLIWQIQLNWVEDRDSGGDWREGQKRRSELNGLTYWRCLFDKGRTGQYWAINLPVSLGTVTESAFQFILACVFWNTLPLLWFESYKLMSEHGRNFFIYLFGSERYVRFGLFRYAGV